MQLKQLSIKSPGIAILVIFILIGSTFAGQANVKYFWLIPERSYFEIAFSLCSIVLLINYIARWNRNRSRQMSVNWPDICVGILLIYICISFLLSKRFNMFPDNFIIWILLCLLYLFIRKTFIGTKRSKINQVFLVIIIFGSIESIHGLLQLCGLIPNIYTFKIGGVFGNPGILSDFIVISYSLSLGLLLNQTKKKIRLLFLALTILQLVLIIVSNARTAWIASFISTALIVYFLKFHPIDYNSFFLKTKKRIWISIVVLCLVLTAGVYLAGFLYYYKAPSANGRLFMYKLCKDLILEKPLFGHGYNSFYSEQHREQIEYFKTNPDDVKNGLVSEDGMWAFNDFLQFTVEFGCVFLLVFLTLLLRLLFFKNTRRDQLNTNLITIGRITLFAALICMSFSYPLENITIFSCFFILLASLSLFDDNIVLKFSLNRTFLNGSAAISIVIMFWLALYSLNSIYYNFKTLKINKLINAEPKKCLVQYANLNIYLHHDLDFRARYIFVMYMADDYERLVKYYEKNGYLFLKTDGLVMFGKAYENLGNFVKAEECYINASCLIPYKFVPKYYLFKLYRKMNDHTMARTMAMKIRDMKIKVYSEEVKNIKTEANEYISSIDNSCLTK